MAGTRIGQRVGPFELAERLEGDGDATLYRAVRPAGSRKPRVVAIRVADDPRDERTAAWVRNEYDVLRALSEPPHPVLPQPYGYYASNVAVALEDVDGITLADALRLRHAGRVPLDASTVVDVLVELAQALRHAHGTIGPQGPVVHGHLTPDQIRLTRGGAVKLMGFGRPSQRRVPSYTPPEQAAGAFVDARSDQWALGSLGVEMLLGQAIYANAEDPTGLALNGRVGPWLDRLERRWPEVCRVLARCLAPAAGDRYAREADLVRDLLAASRTIGGRADVGALVSRVEAHLPRPAPVAPRGDDTAEAPRPAPPERPGDAPPLHPAQRRAAALQRAPGVAGSREPQVDSTLVPLEDDVDPDSVRAAALLPPDRMPARPRSYEDSPTNVFDASKAGELQTRARFSARPILREHTGVEDEVTDTVPGAILETLPAESTPAQAPPLPRVPEIDVAQVRSPEPDTEPDTPLAPSRAAPVADEAPTADVPPAPDAASTSDGAPVDVDVEFEEDDPLADPGSDPRADADRDWDDPLDSDDGPSMAMQLDGPGAGDDDDIDHDAVALAAGDAGLRWTEMLAIVALALFCVTAVSFLAWKVF